MMMGLTGLVAAAIVISIWQYYHEKSQEETEDLIAKDAPVEEATPSGAPVRTSRDIVLQALKELQCEPSVDNENSECIDFEYQAETFRIVIHENNAFITLYDCFWSAVNATNLDDVSNMRRVINDINWQCTANICYTKDDRDNTLNLHNTYSILCTEGSDFKEYLKAMMRESFQVHREFYRRMDIEQNKQRAS